jgi:hypothetical protein
VRLAELIVPLGEVTKAKHTHGVGERANLASLISEGEVFAFIFWYCLLFLREEKRSISVKKGEPLDGCLAPAAHGWLHARGAGKPRPFSFD